MVAEPEEPRSRRMPAFGPVPPLDLTSTLPLRPLRSPLRPSARSIRETMVDLPLLSTTSMSFSSSSTDEDQKPLPLRPESPFILSPLSTIDDSEVSSASTSTKSNTNSMVAPALSKRQHALLELLDSERAYASDLALVRQVHIPLALNQPVALHGVPISPHSSLTASSSSSRVVSTASSSSDSSTSSNSGAPMTPEDVKIIFSNIPELAVFSDQFCDQLEAALGSVVEGGQGIDCVGALFLEIIPDLERPYKLYITRQGGADEHLQQLPKTPALEEYYIRTRTVASSISHAWDLHSLLIKPVQRLLKYPLLLAAIIDATPDDHPDKENLRTARAKVESLAREVNEERRRAEVVKGVLTAGKKKTGGNVGITVSATVNLNKMKSLKRPSLNSNSENGGGNDEATKVEQMEAELRRIEVFAQQFARNIVDWSKSMSTMIQSLRAWALSFGKVIGLSVDQGSEAFDAFLDLVERNLMPLCVDLESVINERLLKEIAHLLETMNKPLKLLASMNEQKPLHYHLLNMNVTAKNRPPPALLEASTNYLALRAQLAKELPNYLGLMHQGISFFVRRLADIQARYYLDMRDRWADLWDMLRVEGEMNGGADETIAVWHMRWADVDFALSHLGINSSRKLLQEPLVSIRTAPNIPATPTPIPTPQEQTSPTKLKKEKDREKERTKSAPGAVNNMLMALEPGHSPQVSAPFPLTPSNSRSRNGRSIDKASVEHLAVRTRSPPGRRQQQYHDSFGDYVAVMSVPGAMSVPQLPRTKSMPQAKVNLDVVDSLDERGRRSAKPGFRRKISDSLRSTSATRRTKSPGGGGPNSALFIPDEDAPQTPSAPYVQGRRPDSHGNGSMTRERRSSWSGARIKYTCQVIHACRPPAPVSYFDFPFFTLNVGEVYGVLQEAGHPGHHPKLPLHVDDGEDCLLLCRDEAGNVGWALASFLQPLG